MSVKRIMFVSGTAIAALGLTAGVAFATVSTPIQTANGEAGYGASSAKPLTNVQAVVTPDQYGTTVQGGALGIQMADQKGTSCYAAQLGLVANTAASTYSVEYGDGSVASATCPVAGILSSAATLGSLTSLPANASVWLSLSYVTHGKRVCVWTPWGHRGQWGHKQVCWLDTGGDAVRVSAEDLDQTSPSVVSKTIPDPADFTFASAGISLDNDGALAPATAGLAEPSSQLALSSVFTGDANAYTSYADQEVAEFDYVSVTQQGGSPEPLDGAGLTPNEAQYSTGGKVVVDMHDSLTATSPYPLTPALGTYTPASITGASTTGNSFQVFTGNSIG
jgi:hypothetical protein